MWKLRVEQWMSAAEGNREWSGREWNILQRAAGAMAMAMCSEAAALRAADHACNN